MKRLTIGFVHPNLGIGGAERLVVDAAVSLQKLGHRVVIYTQHHDINHCFEETRDGTLEVRQLQTWVLPKHIFNRFHIACTIVRSLALAQQVSGDRHQLRFDVLFVDQLSASIPLLRFSQARIFFYCHFPDYLQAPHDGILRRLYRMPFDLLEEFTTGEADEIVVNSRYTQEVFRQAFPRLTRVPRVLQPALNFEAYDRPVDTEDTGLWSLRTQKTMVVSINRFERKKDVGLAVRALAQCLETRKNQLCLVVAGGWDAEVPENVEHLCELVELAKELGLRTRTIAPKYAKKELLPANAVSAPLLLPDATEEMGDVDVVFLPSFSANQRAHLLANARCVVYTPSNEHLGIVPLEAMYMRVPVVAADSGGPRETVAHGRTGLLCEGTAEGFAAGITAVLGMDDARWKQMGEAGRVRVTENNGLPAFGKRLENLLLDMLEREPHAPMVLGVLLTSLILLTFGLVILLAYANVI
ncbi:Alpha-1,3-mannosyltransferase-like protein [Coemansia sp. Benny D115]|nr:Alpha-1,3-mannosyltransferase-like protein [Coemansia sp. Benny D115]